MGLLRKLLGKDTPPPPPLASYTRSLPAEEIPEEPAEHGAPPMFDEEAREAMHIEQEQLQARLESDPESLVVVDVRERRELGRGILPDALCIPLSELEKHTNQLPTGREIVCYCQHGLRSLSAAAFLTSLGFRAKSLRGGYAQWDGPRTEVQEQ